MLELKMEVVIESLKQADSKGIWFCNNSKKQEYLFSWKLGKIFCLLFYCIWEFQPVGSVLLWLLLQADSYREPIISRADLLIIQKLMKYLSI